MLKFILILPIRLQTSDTIQSSPQQNTPPYFVVDMEVIM